MRMAHDKLTQRMMRALYAMEKRPLAFGGRQYPVQTGRALLRRGLIQISHSVQNYYHVFEYCELTEAGRQIVQAQAPATALDSEQE